MSSESSLGLSGDGFGSMLIQSEALRSAINSAEAEGNQIREISTDWIKVRQIIYMRADLSATLAAALRQDERLRMWTSEGTPHNPPEHGFTDDICKESICFPWTRII